MTQRSAWNAEEWATVAEAPLLAGLRVAAAERGGALRETLAIGRTYQEARAHHGESELLDELVATPPAIDRSRIASPGDIAEASGARLRDALRLVDRTATDDEAKSYRWFVRAVAEAAAHAHREGGVLGIGGTPVSEREQSALDDISAVLAGS
jgi:hypothetical protein